MRIAIIIGTRPEAIKLIPVYKELQKCKNFEPLVISTGQHREMLQQVFDFFNVEPDQELDVMRPDQSLSSLTALLVEKLDNYFSLKKFDFIIVQGDTSSCMVASLVAFYYQIKIIHIEAGLRTLNKYAPFPEEINRRLTGVLADIHFAPTRNAADALKKEGIIKNVYVVGNTVIDSLLIASKKTEEKRSHYYTIFKEYGVDFKKKIVLITGHRRENFGKGFAKICDCIAFLASKYQNIQFVYPVHLNPNIYNVAHNKLSDINNVLLIKPLPYDQLVFLMKRSFLILTDSGGIQEEAPTFGIPVLVMRSSTERQEGVDAGCSIICGTEKNKIIETFKTLAENGKAYEAMSKNNNPYGDGNSAKVIKNLLIQLFL